MEVIDNYLSEESFREVESLVRSTRISWTYHPSTALTKNYSEIKTQYEALLFRKDKPSTFKNEDGTTFSGIIKSITETGKLNVWTEDDIIKTFDLKQVTLLY